MPLHLLPKKSWNPYNPVAIARVRADEAAAAARQAETEQRQHEEDAARRIAMLRGETLLPLEATSAADEGVAIARKKRERDIDDRREWRKKRRLPGEDDTDREIRLAREEHVSVGHKKVVRDAKDDREVSLIDSRGNIQLFTPEQPNQRERNSELEAEKRKKEREYEDQYTMKFSNAAGFRCEANGKPWYARGGSNVMEMTAEQAAEFHGLKKGTDVWGREDEGRLGRDAARITAADPMATMKRAQAQLKSATQEKEKWVRSRQHEIQDLRQDQRRQKRKHVYDTVADADLEGFSLDQLSPCSHSRPREKYEQPRRQNHHHNRSKNSSYLSNPSTRPPGRNRL